MSSFYRIALLITACLAVVLWLTHIYILPELFDDERIFPVWGSIALIFFLSLTALTHFINMNAIGKSQKTFTNALYGGIVIRFFFSIFFIAIYLIINEVRDKVFIVEFLLFYLIFTMFEMYHIVTKLRSEK